MIDKKAIKNQLKLFYFLFKLIGPERKISGKNVLELPDLNLIL